jgi:hypothetical protein
MASTNKMINVGGGLFINSEFNFNKNNKGFSRAAKGSIGTSVSNMATNMLKQQNLVHTVRERLQEKLKEKKAGK